jgi:hypothetical protein
MQVVTSCWLVIGGRNTGTPPDIVDRGKRSSAQAVTMAEASALDAAHRAQADSKGEAAGSIARLQRAIPARGSNHGRDPSTWSRINGRGFPSGSTFAGSGGDGVDLARPCAGAPGRLGVWVALMAARPIAPVEIKSVGFAILRSGSPRKRNGPVDRRQQPHISDDCAQILFFEVGKRHCHIRQEEAPSPHFADLLSH